MTHPGIPQAERDVARTPLSESEQKQVIERIEAVLSKNPFLNYYQGFHDVARFSSSDSELEELSLRSLRDFMTPTLVPTQETLTILPELFARADPELGRLVHGVAPYYALAPIITLFCHETENASILQAIRSNVNEYGISYVFYLYTALAVLNKPFILEQTEDESPEVLHSVLANLGSKLNTVDQEKLLEMTAALQRKIPLRRIKAFRRLSGFSALRTGPNIPLEKARTAVQALERKRWRGGFKMLLAMTVIAVGIMLHRSPRR